ncbi:GvpL/GvpF family gas vesicle protein [Myxococcus sp. RHSTA-1-4]|uniref:GvpL/GvpF family gas vesicle protein n=1 Tax=Myxococcus sp. RHSTA-1-4 TaxID=2874601 RepID=UPI001CBC17C8|nr:GvpL/GvpF family gas vesicle protein [Myxococcus sp. RHSTA-1-4]MBZ4422195.1 GvpL/GvpF family gas vesicle protein [Myxococcus sp. RHSTA-1-4]
MPRTSRTRKGSTAKARTPTGAGRVSTPVKKRKPREEAPAPTGAPPHPPEESAVAASPPPGARSEGAALRASASPAAPPVARRDGDVPPAASPQPAERPDAATPSASEALASGERLAAEGGPRAALNGRVTPAPPFAHAVEDEESPQYLYGVVRAEGDLDFGLIGLGVPPADVRSVREGQLAALVSTAPGYVVDPTRAHLLVHQRVTEAVLREHTLLPVAFGTVLRSEAQVRALLRSAHDSLVAALEALDDKVELGLKVLYHREHLIRRLELDNPELLRGEGEGEADHERRLGTALLARVERDMALLLEGLRPLAFASRTLSPVGDRMLLNAAFLVGRDWVESFESRVKSLAARSDTYAFRFTGPWAPYSFVDVRLGLAEEPGAVA